MTRIPFLTTLASKEAEKAEDAEPSGAEEECRSELKMQRGRERELNVLYDISLSTTWI